MKIIIFFIVLMTFAFNPIYAQNNETELVQKLDQIKSAIEDSNVESRNLFLIGILMAGIAIGATMIYAGIIKKESDHRLRPIFSRTKHPLRLNDDYPFFIRNDKVEISFVNTGPLPALDVSQECFIEIHQNNNISNRLPTSGYDTKNVASLGPNESYSLDIPIDARIHYGRILGTEDCYFELNIYYHNYENKKYYYKMKGHFREGFLMLDSLDIN